MRVALRGLADASPRYIISAQTKQEDSEAMSKTQLRKVLGCMTAPQLVDMVVELYEARPEAKEYLDFFVKPDIEAKLEKARNAIRKEMGRSSRGRCKARSTRVRRLVKDISSLNPGAEAVCEIMTYAVEQACAAGSEMWVKEVTQRAFVRLLSETLIKADSAGMLNVYLPRIKTAVDDMPRSFLAGDSFRKKLREGIAETLEGL